MSRGNEMIENQMVTGRGAGAPDRIGTEKDICDRCGEAVDTLYQITLADDKLMVCGACHDVMEAKADAEYERQKEEAYSWGER